jgi:hypothetical protein
MDKSDKYGNIERKKKNALEDGFCPAYKAIFVKDNS